MKYDFEYFKLDHSHIIETDSCNERETPGLIQEALQDFKGAALKYNKRFSPGNDYCVYLAVEKFRKGEFKKSFRVLANFTGRNGFRLKVFTLFFKSILKMPFTRNLKKAAEQE